MDPELEEVLAMSIKESYGREELARVQDAKREEASKKEKGEALGVGELKESEREKFIEELTARLENDALLGYRDKLIALTEKKFLEEKIEGVVKAFIMRLEKEIYGLGRRANVNLFIGIIISAVGLIYMGWVVKLAADVNFDFDSLAGFIPKFSFVVLVEVFAYFFLRIYKGAQVEIKYFQNEISNIELKYISVLMVNVEARDVDSFRATAGALAASERNFILEKGQTTASLEEARQDNIERKNLIDALLKISSVKR
ncbi:MAG: hypothetical protein CUR33_13935 [Pseudomonas sp.]|nr:MAG: hypothetical protein CUR33_13935 [Pseudomonas sp.] [Pseudomonas sp. FEMGT703P]